jgi:hypothetical protein
MICPCGLHRCQTIRASIFLSFIGQNLSEMNIAYKMLFCQLLAWQDEFRTFEWETALPDPVLAMKEIRGLLARWRKGSRGLPHPVIHYCFFGADDMRTILTLTLKCSKVFAERKWIS